MPVALPPLMARLMQVQGVARQAQCLPASAAHASGIPVMELTEVGGYSAYLAVALAPVQDQFPHARIERSLPLTCHGISALAR